MKRFYFSGVILLISASLLAQNFPFKTFYNHKDRVTALAFSPNSKLMASGGKDNVFIIQDVFTRKPILTLRDHKEPINHIVWSNDGSQIVAASDKIISVIDVKNSKIEKKYTTFKEITALEVSGDGNKVYLIAMGMTDSNPKLIQFEVSSGAIQTLSREKHLTDIKLSPDEKSIYVAHDKYIDKINLDDYSDKKTFSGHLGKIVSIDVHVTNNRMVSAGANKVLVWNLETGSHSGFPYKKAGSVKWSGDGKYFLTYIKDVMYLMETESSKEQRMFAGSNAVTSIDFAPRSAFIAMSAASTKIQLYENPWATEDEKMKPPTKTSLITSAKTTEQQINTSTNKQPASNNIANTGLEGLTAAELEVLNRLREKRKNDVISDVDKDIPVSGSSNPYRFALIIGNEDYSTYQTDLTSEVDVDFAAKDATIFKEYAEKTLGIPVDNIQLLTNATAGQMRQALSKLNKITELTSGKAEIFFYYAGHGLPDEVTKEAYLIPVDVAGTNVQYGIKVTDVYASLTEHPTEKITVFLDACFGGGARNQGLLAARGVKIKPKEEALAGKLVVFSASSGDQSSLPYKSKGHGIFTYFLLKKLQESGGNLTYQELSNYIKENVSLKSVVINSKQQDPQTNVSPSAISEWGTWTLN